MTPADRQAVIGAIVATADPRHQGWLRTYLDTNFDAIVADLRAGHSPYKRGFRGAEVQAELIKRGLLQPERQVRS